jgi:hypothetical protein
MSLRDSVNRALAVIHSSMTPAKASAAVSFVGPDGKPLAATLETTEPGAVMAFRLDEGGQPAHEHCCERCRPASVTLGRQPQ